MTVRHRISKDTDGTADRAPAYAGHQAHPCPVCGDVHGGDSRECETRTVIRRDKGRVVVHSHGEEEEPEFVEVPAWAVRAIYAQAGKDPEEEARKLMAALDRMEAERSAT